MTALPSSGTFRWHAGEIALQEQVGAAERMAAVGPRRVHDFMPEQHRAFYAQLPFIVMGAVDEAGDAWATLRTGWPGFMRSPDPRALEIASRRDMGDPAEAGLNDGDAIGLLGIELHSRRRNRLNGRVRRDDDRRFAVEVEQAFGNCPQYIQLRDVGPATDGAESVAAPPELQELQELERLDGRAGALVATADTFFVASYLDTASDGRQVDVSHRGGKPGFVRVEPDGALTIPDFAGNLHFNTLGNILLNPRAGLVCPDFETGDLLQLTGDAEIVNDAPEVAAFRGAERLWRFRPRRIVLRPGALSLRWRMRERAFSANSLMTGSWEDAAAALEAQALRARWRPFRIERIIEESATIRSFHLTPADGKGVIAHVPGQHLPVRLTLPGDETPTIRNYSLSIAPSDEGYRISVKRDGRVSRHLHDAIGEGDLIGARGPTGAFTIDAKATRPAVLLAGGVGITPLLGMLRHLVFEGLRTRRIRPIWLLHATRNRRERAFEREITSLVEVSGGAIRYLRVESAPADHEVEDRDFDVRGRIDVELLKQVLPFDGYDFYLCGPAGFMQSLYDGLRDLGVEDARLHAEAFGPSGLVRRADRNRAPESPSNEPATDAVPVTFAGSAKEARWHPGDGTLLEFAEARGLEPDFGCRAGACGTCRVRVLEGAVAYLTPPTAEVAPDEALICCAVPAAMDDGEAERLILDL